MPNVDSSRMGYVPCPRCGRDCWVFGAGPTPCRWCQFDRTERRARLAWMAWFALCGLVALATVVAAALTLYFVWRG